MLDEIRLSRPVASKGRIRTRMPMPQGIKMLKYIKGQTKGEVTVADRAVT
jgi:hypothetical protein